MSIQNPSLRFRHSDNVVTTILSPLYNPYPHTISGTASLDHSTLLVWNHDRGLRKAWFRQPVVRSFPHFIQAITNGKKQDWIYPVENAVDTRSDWSFPDRYFRRYLRWWCLYQLHSILHQWMEIHWPVVPYEKELVNSLALGFFGRRLKREIEQKDDKRNKECWSFHLIIVIF